MRPIMKFSHLFRFFIKVCSGYGLGKNAFIASMYLRMAKRALPDFVMFKGNKIFLESEDSISFASFGFKSEEYELEIFESEIGSSSVVLDIGASIGLYTLVAARHANEVYSFEPDPINFSNLKRNVEGNLYENVVAINKAVSDKTGESNFLSSSNKSSRSGYYLASNSDNLHNENGIVVEVVALDDFLRDKANEIDVIKMDIEGAELQAMMGMRKLIGSKKELRLFMEFNPYALSRRGADIHSLLDLLSDLDFYLFYIDETNKVKKPVSRERLLSYAENRREGRYINLLCIRKTM
jgi:FkbM family methyltransferase